MSQPILKKDTTHFPNKLYDNRMEKKHHITTFTAQKEAMGHAITKTERGQEKSTRIHLQVLVSEEKAE